MNVKIVIPISFLVVFNNNAFSFNNGNMGDTLNTLLKKPLRVYNTTRLTTEQPAIDGVLDDTCWKTGEWAGDFTQWIPNEGAKPSQRQPQRMR